MSQPNILLLILDSVRARNMSLYGYGRSTTPFLEKFADESTVYTQARSPSIHSVSSHASIFSGYHTEEHNVVEHESKLDPAVNIWQHLSDEYGYNTGVFSPNMIVMASSNLVEPFQTCEGPLRDRLFPTAFSPADANGNSYTEYLIESLRQEQKLKSLLNGLYSLAPYSRSLKSHHPDAESADIYLDLFLEWTKRQSSPWAACINLMDAHYPYIPKTEFDCWGGKNLTDIQKRMRTPSAEILDGKPVGEFQALEPLYDGCIRQLDHYIEYLISSLKKNNEFENTFLVITSDHGEGFAEQSVINPAVELIDHSWGIHEVLTHIPLIVKYPNQTDGHTITNLASLTEFKRVTEELLQDESKPHFNPKNSDYILSSTYRVQEPKDSLPGKCEDKQKYAGPWRAVYTREDGSIIKYVTQVSDQGVVQIEDAQTSYRTNGTTDCVDEVFRELTDVGVNQGKSELSVETKERLEDLGYLR